MFKILIHLIYIYCLANYCSQSSYDQLSKSGFLKLPSGRLLQYYRQFNKQESSWNYENINQMNQNFEHQSYSIQSKELLLGLELDIL
jgi:ribosomal protein S15P/S13E